MIERLYTPQFLDLLQRDDILLIDVREADEYEKGHIPGAVNFPLSLFQESLFPVDRDIIFYCRSGYRSQIAAEYYTTHHALQSQIHCYDYKEGYLGYLQHIHSS